MPASSQTIPAAPAHDVSLAADNLAREKIGNVGADLDNLADELMAYDHGHGNGALRPVVPVVNVDVGAADGRALHANQDVVDADARLGNIFQPEAWRSLL